MLVMVNPPKVTDLDYINFILASQRSFTCTEAARSHPADEGDGGPSHDAFTRLLQRMPQDTEALWSEAKPFVSGHGGVLVLDDTTLDKPYSRKMGLVTYHWSGKHHRVVKGINLVSLLWTDGEKLVPTDFRVYDKPFGGRTKNEHFADMLGRAKERGLNPDCTLFDSWYSSIDNLKLVRSLGWHWFTGLKSNRLVNPDRSGNRAISEVEVPEEGRVVHLKEYGMVRVFKTVSKHGDVDYRATDDLSMDLKRRDELQSKGWSMEVYHRGIKQCCGIERAQVRKEHSQRGHILLSLRVFLRLEMNRITKGMSWYEAKISIIRGAIRSFLIHPTIHLLSTA